MSGFKTLRGDTLAALQARQMALEAQLKQSAKAAAASVVRQQGKKHNWSEEDIENVMGALGLT